MQIGAALRGGVRAALLQDVSEEVAECRGR